jgi:hypothetical protein
VLDTFVLANRNGEDAQITVTSTGDADFQTVNLPKITRALYVQAKTNHARISFEGDTPVVGDHILVAAGAPPVLLLLAPRRTADGTPQLFFASDAAAAASVLTILALE